MGQTGQMEGKKKAVLLRGWRLIREHRRAVSFGVFLSLLATVIGAATSYSLKILIDKILIPKDGRFLWPLQIAYFVAIITGAAIEIWQVRIFRKMSAKIMTRVKTDAYSRMLEQDYLARGRVDNGVTMNLFTSGLESLNNLFCRGIPMAIASVISILITVSLMFWIDWRLTLISLLVYPALMWVNRTLQRKVGEQDVAVNAQNESVMGTLGQTQKLKDEIATYGLEKQMTMRFEEDVKEYYSAHVRLHTFLEVLQRSGWVLIMVPYQAILFGIGGVWYLKTGEPTIGTLLIFSNFTNYLIGPVMRLVNIGSDIAMAKKAFERLDRFEEIPQRTVQHPSMRAGISRFRDVSFAYSADAHPVVEHLTTEFAPKKVTILWGPSGCGKSTVLKLLYGLITPTEGEIAYYDPSPRTPRGKTWVYFPQDPHLFDGVLREQFLMVRPSMTEAEMWKCLEAVRLDQVFRQRKGLDSALKNPELMFSGGQHRRLCLAILLAYDADIIIMDEPTASLDEESAVDIARVVRMMRDEGGKSFIISTHDPKLREIGDEVVQFSTE